MHDASPSTDDLRRMFMWHRRRPPHGYRPWIVKVPAYPHQPADELQLHLQLTGDSHPAFGVRRSLAVELYYCRPCCACFLTN